MIFLQDLNDRNHIDDAIVEISTTAPTFYLTINDNAQFTYKFHPHNDKVTINVGQIVRNLIKVDLPTINIDKSNEVDLIEGSFLLGYIEEESDGTQTSERKSANFYYGEQPSNLLLPTIKGIYQLHRYEGVPCYFYIYSDGDKTIDLQHKNSLIKVQYDLKKGYNRINVSSAFTKNPYLELIPLPLGKTDLIIDGQHCIFTYENNAPTESTTFWTSSHTHTYSTELKPIHIRFLNELGVWEDISINATKKHQFSTKSTKSNIPLSTSKKYTWDIEEFAQNIANSNYIYINIDNDWIRLVCSKANDKKTTLEYGI